MGLKSWVAYAKAQKAVFQFKSKWQTNLFL
jgi:hypothetical protein